eukprot:170083_1
MSSIFRLINICISGIILLSILIVLRRFIQHYNKVIVKTNTTRSLFFIGLFFIVNTFLSMFIWTLILIFHYLNIYAINQFIYILHILFSIIYLLQYYSLLLSLFTRLSNTFRDSGFMQLQLKTIKNFRITYGTTLIIFIVCVTNNNYIRGTILWTICIAILYIFIVTWISLIISSFNSKLIQIYQLNTDNTFMLSIVVKTTTLSSISIFTSILSMIVIMYRFYIHFNPPTYMIAICDLIITLDIYTNFLCIVLAFNYFINLYNKSCGWLHKIFHYLWIHLLNVQKQIDQKDTQMTKISPHSKQNTTEHLTVSNEKHLNTHNTLSSNNNIKIPKMDNITILISDDEQNFQDINETVPLHRMAYAKSDPKYPPKKTILMQQQSVSAPTTP